jgi:histidine kinase
MANLSPGVKILKENSFWSVYQWHSHEHNRIVILKLLNANIRNGHLKQLADEFGVTQQLDLPFVRKAVEKVKMSNREGLVLEFVEGITLKEWVRRKTSFNVTVFLSMAIKITDQFLQVHEKGFYHRDINPENIIVDESLSAITLIDFDLAAPFDSLNEHPLKDAMEGTMAYLSPEQTGRTSRKVDYRTDIYSLGITFYECITSALPFNFADPSEMVHAHLAIEPKSVHEVRSGIPLMISLIIKKMMEKNAEMRYQSLAGVKADLLRCKDLLEHEGTIGEFQLGEKDFSGHFNIPHLMFGREDETLLLRQKLDSAIQHSTCEVVLISGEAGAGKSTLAAHLHPHLVERHGYFASGKYSDPRLGSPYSALITAFKELTNVLLSETEEAILEWKDLLNQAVGDSGNVLTEVVPELKLIIGQQPPIVQLGARESAFRFSYVFTNFIRAVSARHPLVIFLDDLQWADEASLLLIKTITTEKDLGKVLLIASCREEEVSPNHVFTSALSEISKSKEITRLHLRPLRLDAIVQIVLKTIKCPASKATALAKLIEAKTLGNAFFVNQFLKSLYEREYLKWNASDGWHWREQEIEALNITDNVVDLLCQSIRKMDATTQETLRVGACLGAVFGAQELAFILNADEQLIVKSLRQALKNGLISYAVIGTVSRGPEFRKFRFTHDRIQQAAYSLLDVGQRIEWHYRIANALLLSNRNDTDSHIFEVVNHFRISDQLIVDSDLKIKVARLNFEAGIRAKKSVAFPQAHSYFQEAINLLQSFKPWISDYQLSLTLYTDAAETAYLTGNFDQMEDYLAEVLRSATSLLDKVKAYEIKIQFLQSQNKLIEAVELAVYVLGQLGAKLPTRPTKLHILASLLWLQVSLPKSKIKNLEKLPKMTDPKIISAMRILVSINSSAYFASPSLFPLLVFKQVQLSLKFGNCEFSPFAYASFGVVKTGVLNDIEGGFRLGKAAEKLLGQFQSQSGSVRTMIVTNGFLFHWKSHPRNFVLTLPSYFNQAKEVGDIEYAALCAFNQTLYGFCLGQSLQRLEQAASERSEIIRSYNQNTPLQFNQIFLQTIINLRGGASDPTKLIGKEYDESHMLEVHLKANDKTSLFACYLQKAYLCFLFDQLEEAKLHIEKAQYFLDSAVASVIYPIYFYYDSLIQASWLIKQPTRERKIRHRINSNLKKVKKWAVISPEHHGHRYQLIQAMVNVLNNRDYEATNCFEEAAKLAKDNQFTQDEALIKELAGKYYLS